MYMLGLGFKKKKFWGLKNLFSFVITNATGVFCLCFIVYIQIKKDNSRMNKTKC